LFSLPVFYHKSDIFTSFHVPLYVATDGTERFSGVPSSY